MTPAARVNSEHDNDTRFAMTQQAENEAGFPAVCRQWGRFLLLTSKFMPPAVRVLGFTQILTVTLAATQEPLDKL